MHDVGYRIGEVSRGPCLQRRCRGRWPRNGTRAQAREYGFDTGAHKRSRRGRGLVLDSTGGVRLVRACTAMEPAATLSVPVVQCTGRSRFPLPPRSIANKKRESSVIIVLLIPLPEDGALE